MNLPRTQPDGKPQGRMPPTRRPAAVLAVLAAAQFTVEAVCAGHLEAAPKAFAVPMTTHLVTHGRIVADEDHYSLATVLTRSGLPADRTPPAS